MIKRIYKDADREEKIEDMNQLEDMRIIRDATVRDDMPAIIVCDTNVHKSKYSIMNGISAKVGVGDTLFSDMGAAAEAARLDSGATDQEIREQTNILHHIRQMSD